MRQRLKAFHFFNPALASQRLDYVGIDAIKGINVEDVALIPYSNSVEILMSFFIIGTL